MVLAKIFSEKCVGYSAFRKNIVPMSYFQEGDCISITCDSKRVCGVVIQGYNERNALIAYSNFEIIGILQKFELYFTVDTITKDLIYIKMPLRNIAFDFSFSNTHTRIIKRHEEFRHACDVAIDTLFYFYLLTRWVNTKGKIES